MTIKTAKFGGSSLADANQFRKVKAIIEADPARRFVVVSAPGKRFSGDDKVTDLLYRLFDQYSTGAEGYSATFEKICDRFVSIEKELGLSTNIIKELEAIEKNLIGGASVDYIASRGEYLNGLLMAAYLNFDFVDAAEIVCFHSDGAYDDENTVKWAQRLEDCEHAVIPGFYGRTRKGVIRTFSRGGSDITGAIVARSSQSVLYENWTDVPGFMMADPRIVENPKVIRTVI